MTVKWEQDKDTGIQKQIVEDYTVSSDLPGATVIPSHRGRHGRQAGKEKRAPIPMIVDPDRADGGIVVTPDMLDQSSVAAVSGNDPSQAFETLANKPKKSTMTKKNTITKPAAKVAKPVAVKAVPAKARPQEPDEEIYERVPESSAVDMSELIAGVADALLPSIQDMLGSMAAERLETAPEAVPETVPAPDLVSDAPKIQVSLTTPEGSCMSLRYHHVLETAGDVVVFIYDTKFQHGDRVYPAPDLTRPYDVEVIKDGETQTSFKALYMGIKFTFKGWEFQVLIKDAGKAAK